MEIVDKIFQALFKRMPGRWMLILGIGIVLVVTLMALLAPVIAPYDPTTSSVDTFQPPSWKHPMGTLEFEEGQDIVKAWKNDEDVIQDLYDQR